MAPFSSKKTKSGPLCRMVWLWALTGVLLFPVEKPGAEEMTHAIETWEAGDLNRLLEEVDALLRAQEYEKARLLLLRSRVQMPEGPEKIIIDRGIEVVEEEERTSQKPPQILLQDMAQLENRVKNLIEEEKYEEAFQGLAALEGPGAFPSDSEPGRLKAQALDGIINRERNRAAELFLRARQEKDPEEQRRLLYASRNILTRLMEQYPLARQHPTLDTHIAVIDEALEGIGQGPSLP